MSLFIMKYFKTNYCHTGLGCQIAVCVTMLLWRPESDKAYVTYILAAFWGIGDAVNQPLTMGNR